MMVLHWSLPTATVSAHGIDMMKGLEQQKAATQSGVWPLYRYNPINFEEGKNPLTLDSKDPTISVKDYAYKENRYRMLVQAMKHVQNYLCAKPTRM